MYNLVSAKSMQGEFIKILSTTGLFVEYDVTVNTKEEPTTAINR